MQIKIKSEFIGNSQEHTLEVIHDSGERSSAWMVDGERFSQIRTGIFAGKSWSEIRKFMSAAWKEPNPTVYSRQKHLWRLEVETEDDIAEKWMNQNKDGQTEQENISHE